MVTDYKYVRTYIFYERKKRFHRKRIEILYCNLSPMIEKAQHTYHGGIIFYVLKKERTAEKETAAVAVLTSFKAEAYPEWVV